MKRIWRPILWTILLSFIAEWGLSFLIGLYREKWELQVTPTYSWSVLTGAGERVGSKNGILKLMLRPYITYGNFPKQDTPYFKINSRGFRGPEFELDPQGKSRIILVGGSAAFGTGLQSDNETLAAHLSKLLGVEVINAAVIGHHSGQEYAYVATELIDYRPTVILAFDGWNDFMENSFAERVVQAGDVGFYQIEQQLLTLTDLTNGDIFTRMRLSLREIFFPTIWKGIAQGVVGIRERLAGSYESTVDKSADIYIKNHLRLHKLTSSLGIRSLVCLQPDLRVIKLTQQKLASNSDEEKLASNYISFLDKARKELTSQAVQLIDFRDHLKIFDSEVFMDNVHLDSSGNARLAEVLADEIKSRNLLP